MSVPSSFPPDIGIKNPEQRWLKKPTAGPALLLTPETSRQNVMSQERGSHSTAGKNQLSTHSPCSPERSKVTASTPALDFWKGKKETHLNSDSAQFCRLSSSQLFQDSFLSPLERSQRCERQCVRWGRGCFEAFLAFHCPPGLFILCFVKLY